MAFAFVEDHGAANTKVNGTTVSKNPASTIPVGAVVIVYTTSDNVATADGASTTHSVSDSQGNTYTRGVEVTESTGAAQDGVTAGIFSTVITTQLGVGDTITLTVSSATDAKALSVIEFSVAANSTIAVGSGTVNPDLNQAANAGSASVAVTGLANQEWLLCGVLGRERPTGDTYTADADYTDGTEAATSGGVAASNVHIHPSYRIATLTTDTYAPSCGTANSVVGALIAYDEVPGGVSAAAGTASEADSAFALGVKLGINTAAEADSAVALGVKLGINTAGETDTAMALGIKLGIGTAVETDSAFAIAASVGGAPQSVAVGTALETDSAFAIGVKIGIGTAQETDTAFPITGAVVRGQSNTGKWYVQWRRQNNYSGRRRPSRHSRF